jgi:hypothetical protein
LPEKKNDSHKDAKHAKLGKEFFTLRLCAFAGEPPGPNCMD